MTSSDAFDLSLPFTFLAQNPATYTQAVEQERQTHPSLTDLRPADPNRYLESVEANKKLIEAQLRQLQDHLEQLGAIHAAAITLPTKLIPETFQEPLDMYEKEFRRDATKLPSGDLKPNDEKRIITRAGDYPIHVVTAWLGNTPTIALRHYLLTTDADFERASRGDGKAVQHDDAPRGTDSHDERPFAEISAEREAVRMRADQESWGTRIRT